MKTTSGSALIPEVNKIMKKKETPGFLRSSGDLSSNTTGDCNLMNNTMNESGIFHGDHHPYLSPHVNTFLGKYTNLFIIDIYILY